MRRDRGYGWVGAAAMLGTLAACGDAAPPKDVTPAESAPPEIVITARAGALAAPDTVGPGWVRVRVDETDDGHIIVIFRLPPNTSAPEAAAFVAALDSAPATPSPGVALGGLELGSRGAVVVHLTPGYYMAACLKRGDDERRHTSRAEFRRLIVRPATPADSALAAPPKSTNEIQLVDFAYAGPDQWEAGPQLLRIENAGKQDHQLRLARLRDGATLQAWMSAENPDTVATTVAGMARVGPGEVAYLPVDLTPGTYVAYCLVTDGATKRPHVMLGMLRTYQVRAGVAGESLKAAIDRPITRDHLVNGRFVAFSDIWAAAYPVGDPVQFLPNGALVNRRAGLDSTWKLLDDSTVQIGAKIFRHRRAERDLFSPFGPPSADPEPDVKRLGTRILAAPN